MEKETKEIHQTVPKEKEVIYRWFSPEIPVYFSSEEDAPCWILTKGKFRAQSNRRKVSEGRLNEVSAWLVTKLDEDEGATLYRDQETRKLSCGELVFLFNREARRRRGSPKEKKQSVTKKKKEKVAQGRLPEF